MKTLVILFLVVICCFISCKSSEKLKYQHVSFSEFLKFSGNCSIDMTELGRPKGKTTLYLTCNTKKIYVAFSFPDACKNKQYEDMLDYYYKYPSKMSGKVMIKKSMDSIIIINDEKFCTSGRR